MKVAAISFTDNGAKLIEEIKNRCSDPELITGPDVRECFEKRLPILFVGACGIAVRLIAPHLKDKLTDPPVLVMDEAGGYIIPILSGHVGGANDLARKLAEVTGATPVITTATDVNQTFAIDEFAMENHLTIQNKDRIKTVSGKVLKGEPIRISIEGFPPGEDVDVVIGDRRESEETVAKDILAKALWLTPKHYVIGIGCRKGKTCPEIEAPVQQALESLGITYDDIYAFGSIDLKAEEEGLLDFSRIHRIPFVTFPAELLEQAVGDFTPSEFVKETTGVDNVCERAAALLAGNRGTPVLKKLAENGVTVAIYRRKQEF